MYMHRVHENLKPRPICTLSVLDRVLALRESLGFLDILCRQVFVTMSVHCCIVLMALPYGQPSCYASVTYSGELRPGSSSVFSLNMRNQNNRATNL